MKKVNNDPEILPYHLLCLQLSLSTSITTVIAHVFDEVLTANVPAVVDVTPDRWSTILQGLVLPHGIPTVRYATVGQSTHYLSVNDLEHIFMDLDSQSEHIHSVRMDALTKFSSKYFFTIGPDSAIPFEALYGLAVEFGWKQIGVIVKSTIHAKAVDTRYVYIKDTDLR